MKELCAVCEEFPQPLLFKELEIEADIPNHYWG